jgi:hypothetical protein
MRPLSPLDIDAVLAEVALDQFGLVTLAQAAERGIDGDSLEVRTTKGVLRRAHPSVYRLAAIPQSQDQTTLAAWLALSARNVSIARISAAQIHGLPIGSRKPDMNVELVAFGDQQRRLPGITLRRVKTKPETHGWHGARITNPSQTLCDLAAVLSGDTLTRCIDHAIGSRVATVASIHRVVLARPAAGFTGRAVLLELVNDRADGAIRHRSMIEQRVGKWLQAAGLGGFVPNYLITEAGDLEVDFAWPHSYVSLDISPFFTHGSEKKQQRDMERRRLLAPTAWTMIEATDSDLRSPEAFTPIVVELKYLLSRDRYPEPVAGRLKYQSPDFATVDQPGPVTSHQSPAPTREIGIRTGCRPVEIPISRFSMK